MITKRGALISVAAAAVFTCIFWLSTLLAARSNHAEGTVFWNQVSPGDSRLMNRNAAARAFDEPSSISASSDAFGASAAEIKIGDRSATEDAADGNPATPGPDAGKEESGGIPAALAESDGWNGELHAEQGGDEDVFSLKERIIRERFGMILRNRKWIPTVGEGTNLVYITTGSLQPGRVDEAYEARFEAASGFPPYLWKIADGTLPKSFSLDVNSGTLSGSPSAPSTVSFLLEVTDSGGARDVAEYFLIIQPEQELEIVTETLPAAFPGEEYSFQLKAAGGVPPYAWSGAGDLDEIGNLELDPMTGRLFGEIFEFCPLVDIQVVLLLSDAQLDVSKEFVFHIRTGLSILGVDALSVPQSDQIEFSFEATGGLDPYTWNFDGDLPPGLTFYSDGVCTGVPTEPGNYEIDVWVQDDAGEVASLPVAIEVLPVAVDAVSGFEALLSRNSVALSWTFPCTEEDAAVHVVRNSISPPSSPSDGITICQGNETSCLDADAGAGTHYYAAFLELGGTLVTSAPAPAICAKLPPDMDFFADKVVSVGLLNSDAFRSDELPDIVLGAPMGTGLEQGSLNVVSLGAATCEDGGASAPYGGSIVLEFVDNLVWDGPGPDFTVFENVFYIYNDEGVLDVETRFMEPAVVSVSQDGITWHRFKTDFSPRYDPDSGELNLRHPYCYNAGFAGVNPVMSNGCDPDPTDIEVSGGDSFDLADVGLNCIHYVWIQSTGNRWMVDDDGDLIYHTEDFGAASRTSCTSGFDLDAVTAIWMEKVSAE